MRIVPIPLSLYAKKALVWPVLSLNARQTMNAPILPNPCVKAAPVCLLLRLSA